jgi:hypothetical protein
MNNVYRIFEYKFHVMETIQNDTIKIYFYYAESFLVHKDAKETREYVLEIILHDFSLQADPIALD